MEIRCPGFVSLKETGNEIDGKKKQLSKLLQTKSAQVRLRVWCVCVCATILVHHTAHWVCITHARFHSDHLRVKTVLVV